jgi:hypothetical protein
MYWYTFFTGEEISAIMLLKKQFSPRLVKNIRMQGARNQEE